MTSTAAAARGDAHARDELTALFRRHISRLTRFLRGLGVREADLDDVLQETFTVAWRRRDSLRPDASPLAWVFGIARRTASSYRRRRDLRESTLRAVDSENELPGQHSHESAVGARELARRVESFVDTLEPIYREVFLLSLVEELSAVKIAQVTGTNLNTIYSRIRKVRQDFAEFTRDQGLELP